MIKVKPFTMHMHRGVDPMVGSDFAEDNGYYEAFNRYFIPDKSYIYKDLQLVNDDSYDYAIVLDQIFYREQFDPAKSILFRLEPEILRRNFELYNKYIKPEKYVKVYDLYVMWSIPYDDLDSSNFTKTKRLSSIMSSGCNTEMQMKRLNLAYNISEKMPYSYDHYGRGNFNTMKSYKGPIDNRIDGLKAYKYHYNAENNREDTGFSEKILDSLLCECLTFYDGCTGLERFIDPNAFIRIDVNDTEKSIAIIRDSMANNEWEKRIDIIRKAKWKTFHKMNILELTHNAIKGIKNYFE